MTLLLPSKSATRKIRVFSYGGGVQSTAVLALQAAGRIEPYDYMIFANVGDDSEHPDVRRYLDNYAKPFAEDHGIRLIEIMRNNRDHGYETLWEHIDRLERSIPIPVYMSGGSPGTRSCTIEFKIRTVDRYIRRTLKPTHAVVGLGISTDEFTRARDTNWHDREYSSRKRGKHKERTTLPRRLGFHKQLEYPLLKLGYNREVAVGIVKLAGLPAPPRSACFFCPFSSPQRWLQLFRESPELIDRAVWLESEVNRKRAAMGRDQVRLHKYNIPLMEAIAKSIEQEDDSDDEFTCDAASCNT